jgi:hypothetical protein
MHARRPALPLLRLRGAAAVVLGAAMLAALLPATIPARGGQVNTPVLAVTSRDAAPAAPDLSPFATAPGQGPSEMYLDAQRHAGDPNEFVPGGRVSVGFQPRAVDGSTVGGRVPGALPAGRLSGMQMASDAATTPSSEPGAPTVPAAHAAYAAPAATGLRRDVYGFLPYWEVSDSSNRLNFSVLSHVAYFSLGADGSGNLLKRNSDGLLTTGWAGWTSAGMTDVITQAHVAGARVTLTLSVFAWTANQASIQAALLGSPTARANLARQAVAAVRDRGADGINLDFEPLVRGHEDEFVALVREIRAGFEAIGPGYHLSFDTMGQPANYPLEPALAAGGADAVFVDRKSVV